MDRHAPVLRHAYEGLVPGKYIDFDAAIAEAEDSPVVVHYLGCDWTLYSAIPAKPVFKLLRMQADGLVIWYISMPASPVMSCVASTAACPGSRAPSVTDSMRAPFRLKV